jgi:hypothetical protein
MVAACFRQKSHSINPFNFAFHDETSPFIGRAHSKGSIRWPGVVRIVAPHKCKGCWLASEAVVKLQIGESISDKLNLLI